MATAIRWSEPKPSNDGAGSSAGAIAGLWGKWWRPQMTSRVASTYPREFTFAYQRSSLRTVKAEVRQHS